MKDVRPGTKTLAAPRNTSHTSLGEYLGTDILVVNKDFSPLPTGDVETCQGFACLAQDLVHRLGTPRGDLWLHPDYGLDIQRFVHLVGSPTHILDFQMSVAQEVERDPRVEPGSARVEVLEWGLEAVRLRLTVRPIGETNPLNLVLGYDLSALTLEVVRGY